MNKIYLCRGLCRGGYPRSGSLICDETTVERIRYESLTAKPMLMQVHTCDTRFVVYIHKWKERQSIVCPSICSSSYEVHTSCISDMAVLCSLRKSLWIFFSRDALNICRLTLLQTSDILRRRLFFAHSKTAGLVSVFRLPLHMQSTWERVTRLQDIRAPTDFFAIWYSAAWISWTPRV